MKKKYKYTDKGKNQELNEPSISYQTQNRIKIFNSFEEAKQDEINHITIQSPIERLRQTVDLILKVYNVSREELKARNNFKQIKIIKS